MDTTDLARADRCVRLATDLHRLAELDQDAKDRLVTEVGEFLEALAQVCLEPPSDPSFN